MAAFAYATLCAVILLTGAVLCIVGAGPVQALPSYARQTGQQCAACHNGFPELTPYGRQFKLNGYTWTGGTSNLPPIAAMAIPTFTNVRKGVDGGLAPGFGFNNDFAFTGSLFYGGKIFDGLGSFAQVTYDNVPNRIHWDNIDLRYATPSELFGSEAVFGVSANNNPTVNDVWNSTPAWGLSLSRFRAGANSGRHDIDRRYFCAAGYRPQPLYLLEPVSLRRGRRISHIVTED